MGEQLTGVLFPSVTHTTRLTSESSTCTIPRRGPVPRHTRQPVPRTRCTRRTALAVKISRHCRARAQHTIVFLACTHRINSWQCLVSPWHCIAFTSVPKRHFRYMDFGLPDRFVFRPADLPRWLWICERRCFFSCVILHALRTWRRKGMFHTCGVARCVRPIWWPNDTDSTRHLSHFIKIVYDRERERERERFVVLVL